MIKKKHENALIVVTMIQPGQFMGISITFTYTNFNGYAAEAWEWISNLSHILQGVWLRNHAGFKITHVGKRGHWMSNNKCILAKDIMCLPTHTPSAMVTWVYDRSRYAMYT